MGERGEGEGRRGREKERNKEIGFLKALENRFLKI